MGDVSLEIAEMRPESLAGTTNCGQLGLFTGGTLKLWCVGVGCWSLIGS